jgi:hypothetical protein
LKIADMNRLCRSIQAILGVVMQSEIMLIALFIMKGGRA